jgi:putative Mn2+ efflux pump MntP
MPIYEILLIALGLSMDAFAVSIASGVTIERLRVRHALVLASTFGGFQALMPVLGWLGGLSLRGLVSAVDHWIAFLLLTLIGAKMIWEAARIENIETRADPMNILVLLMLALATSIDALAVGITFAFLQLAILAPVLIIGAVTFGISLAGVYIGKASGHFCAKKIGVLGGLVLIGIGLRILIAHLLAP